MNALIHAALRFRTLTLLLAAVLALAGLQAWRQLPIDAFPDISPTQAKIILKIPGMTPEEVELRVVRPIEQELLSIPHKRMVRSVSKYGIADITLDFEDRTDIYWARQQVSERLGGVMGDLPAGVSGGLAPITTPLSELYMFTVEGEGFSLAQKRRVLDWVIRPELRTVPGVAEVNALGGEVQTFEVVPRPERMAAQGISMAELRQALARNAEWMKSNLDVQLWVEGHCDERGTSAYNLVLGEKRAKAVRNYMVELGVTPKQLSVVSYGKERPVCKEHAESCYSQNRRGHMVVKTGK